MKTIDWNETKLTTEELENSPITILNLPTKTKNALLDRNITTIKRLTSKTRNKLWNTTDNLGQKGLDAIEKQLQKHNLSLKPHDTTETDIFCWYNTNCENKPEENSNYCKQHKPRPLEKIKDEIRNMNFNDITEIMLLEFIDEAHRTL